MSFTDAAHVAESIAVAGVESGKANTAIVLDLRHGPHTRSIDICDAMDIVRAARSAAPAVVTFSKVIRGTYRATVGVYEITVENMGDCWASTIHRNAKMVDTFFKGTRSDAERAALAKVAR